MTEFFSSLFSPPPGATGLVDSVLVVWNNVWWIVLPLVTGMIFWNAWLIYLSWKWHHNLHFKLLEIKIPKNILKTPKAMEQIFAAAHAPYSYGIKFWDKYWKGQKEYWMAFELVGRAGESRFYLRVPSKFRNMMEAAIYSQFPEAEIVEAEDYLDAMPKIIPNKDLTIDGFDEVLRHESYRPIRTYVDFEDPTDERRVDTMGGLLEAMSKLRDDEQLWFQVILVPTGEDIQKEGEKAINKILHIEEDEKKKGGFLPRFDLGISLGEAVAAPFEHPGPAKDAHDEAAKQNRVRFLVGTHEKERAEAIQRKISKLSFEATLRFVHVQRKDSPVKPEHLFSVHGYIRQFNTQDLNSLKPDKVTTTAGYAVKGLFKNMRLHWRRRMLYESYRYTGPSHHESILNIEELATVFHFPTTPVATSELEKVESRKGTPPATLPVIED